MTRAHKQNRWHAQSNRQTDVSMLESYTVSLAKFIAIGFEFRAGVGWVFERPRASTRNCKHHILVHFQYARHMSEGKGAGGINGGGRGRGSAG